MFRKRKLLAFGLALLMLLTVIPVLASPGEAYIEQEFVLGNSLTNSLHGGQMAEVDNTLFWADHTGIYAIDVLLTDQPGQNLNVIGGGLYFTVGDEELSTLRRLDLTTGETATLFSWTASIDQLLITGDNEALFLADGRVHRKDLTTGGVVTDATAFAVTRFIPTAYGTIYATGGLGDFTLYAGDELIEAGVALFFTERDDLIIRRGTEDYQVPFAALFADGPAELTAYVYRPIIETFAFSDEYVEMETHDVSQDVFPDDNICPIPFNAAPPIETMSLPLTQSQRNVVLRARQQLEIRWTPLQDITGWRGNNIFRAGETYIGIPYAQPIHSGRYIPWGITQRTAAFEHFRDAVLNINSNMYRSFSFNGTHATIAPFYGSDCSAFVAWSVNHPQRTTTHSFPNFANRISRNLTALQVGDVFNSTGHNILVTAVEFDLSGNVAAIETMEQTVPLPRHIRWGAGGNRTIPQLWDMLNRSNYHFYRPTTIGNVPFTPSPAVNVADGARHIITAIAGQGGVISPAGLNPVPHGYDQRFVFHPEPGFVAQVIIDGVNQGPMTEFTFQNVTQAHRLEVVFELTHSPFVDVPAHAWYHEFVFYAFQNNLMLGTSATHFSPGARTTRAEFVAVLARISGINTREWARTGTVVTQTGGAVNVRAQPNTTSAVLGTRASGSTVEIIGQVGNWYQIIHGNGHGFMSRDFVRSQSTFSDVGVGAWYAPYVAWARANNVVAGDGSGFFHPSRHLAREEMATILHNYVTRMGINLPQDPDVPPFVDIDLVTWWAVPGVTAMQQAGVIRGDGVSFNPQGFSTRAEMTTMLVTFVRNHG
ncbi:MAG: S-layer homology domain-containing protein [Oscillospiraceae bacterium]|nr:S-layer homology domain-containing protein [Oscillospiraceae bacterium]